MTLADIPVRAVVGVNHVNNIGASQSPSGIPALQAVFYTFIAENDGTYNVNTCGQLTGFGPFGDGDSYIAIYAVNPTNQFPWGGDGGQYGYPPYVPNLQAACTSTPIASNDDVCGVQSSVNFTAAAGQTYVIAIAECCGFAYGFTGTFSIAFTGPRSGQPLKPKPDNPNRREKKEPKRGTL